MEKITFEKAQNWQQVLQARVDRASAVLREFPKGPMGITPDEVKFSPEFREAKATFDHHFAELKKFNKSFTKIFAEELRDQRRAKYNRAPA